MTDQQHRPTGFVVFGLGVLVIVMAWTVSGIPTGRRWIMVVCGVAFSLAGLQVLTGAKGRSSSLIAGTIFALLSVLGLYAAFSDQRIGGGIPFIPDAWNQAFGHGLFGLGAVFTAAAAVYCYIKAARRD